MRPSGRGLTPGDGVTGPWWGWALAGAALVLVLGALIAVMSEPEPRLAGTNNVRLAGYPVELAPGDRFCQSGERVPADARSMQLDAGTEGRPGPRLALTLAERRIAVPGGYVDGPLSIAVSPDTAGATGFCIRNRGDRRVFFGGQTASSEPPPGLAASIGREPIPAVARVLYWRAGEESGWKIAGAAFERWSHVTALGVVTPWLASALLIGACIAAIALAARGRATAAACAVIATAAAGGWALTTPAFHVPDEPQHVAYAQYLAETGKLPRPVLAQAFSPEEGVAFGGALFNNVAGNPTGRPPWSEERDAGIDKGLASDPGRVSEGGGTNTTNNPPFYYALEVVPYTLASGGDFLDRLLAMRLLSVLLAGLTAAFVFLFLRELLPRAPWAWTAGALAFAVQPLLGFASSGVNNDAGLFAAGAAILWLVARAFRRGLDVPIAIGIGAATGLGLVTKATLVGFAPGLLVVLVVLLLRAAPEQRRRVLGLGALSLAVATLPVLAYVVLNGTVWDRPLWSSSVPGSTGESSGRPAQVREFLSYLWQFYLPRPPFMLDQQTGLPLYEIWFKGLIGRYGWLDTVFPLWAYQVALAPFAAAMALAAYALWRARDELVRRSGEVLAYLALAAGLVVVVGWAGYIGRLSNGFVFEQARYLLPLGGLYAALIALAANAGGRRLGPAIGCTLVVLACGHALLSVLLVAGRYYV